MKKPSALVVIRQLCTRSRSAIVRSRRSAGLQPAGTPICDPPSVRRFQRPRTIRHPRHTIRWDGRAHGKVFGTLSSSLSCPAFAFTLVELLVVLAVIAILSALFLPALIRSKTSAQRIACGGNLRQLGLAVQMYWDDNSGNAFPWRGAATNGGQIYWFGWLQNGTEGNRIFDRTLGALYPYLGGRGVEVCSSLNYIHPQFKLKATGAAYGYAYNILLSAAADEPPINAHKIQRSSETVFLADAAQVNTFQAPATPQNPMLEEFYYLSTNETTVHFRHGKTANALFCDGHVAREKPAKASLDTRLATQVVGRLRPEILATH